MFVVDIDIDIDIDIAIDDDVEKPRYAIKDEIDNNLRLASPIFIGQS
jgi:hypothetical protein